MSEQLTESIFDGLHDPFAVRRIKMLPWWIKLFCWIFLLLAAAVPVGFAFNLLTGDGVRMSVYGITTFEPFSIAGLLVTAIFASKGVVAYGLLREHDWAVRAGLIEALASLALCIITMFTGDFIQSFQTGDYQGFNMRLEIAFIIPYLLKLRNIKDEWEANIFVKQQGIQPR